MATAFFLPQVWVHDYAVEADPLGPQVWDIGSLTEDEFNALEMNSYERDELRFHPNAPEWVREWSGPFEVYIEKGENQ